jgi:hypothetical protein
MRPLRHSLITLLFAALPVAAATTPPDLQPVPEPPPLPAGVSDQDEEPQVTITQHDGNKEEEYRTNGKLYMIKVTPPHGTPYYLVDEQGNGVMMRKDYVTSPVRPPMWVIKRW